MGQAEGLTADDVAPLGDLAGRVPHLYEALAERSEERVQRVRAPPAGPLELAPHGQWWLRRMVPWFVRMAHAFR